MDQYTPITVTLTPAHGDIFRRTDHRSAVKHHIFDLDIRNLDEFTSVFLSRSGLLSHEILDLVDPIREGHSQVVYTDTTVSSASNPGPVTFHTLQLGWDELGGTVPIGKLDEALRREKAPRPGHHTCALDVALFIGIHLNLGRIRRDIVTPRYMGQLSLPTRVFLWTIAGPWGVMPQDQRDQARDLVARTLSATNPWKFRRGKAQCVQSLLDTVLHGIPQVSWTEASTEVCCDQQIRMNDRARAQLRSSVQLLHLDHKTISECVNAYFMETVTLAQGHQRCTRRGRCTESRTRRPHTVLEGTGPARLMVHFTGPCPITWQHDSRQGLHVFDDLQLQTFSLEGRRTLPYRVVAAIFMVETNHCVARWKIANDTHSGPRIRHFDSGRCTVVPTWWTWYDGNDHPSSVGLPRVLTPTPRTLPRVLTIVYEAILQKRS